MMHPASNHPSELRQRNLPKDKRAAELRAPSCAQPQAHEGSRSASGRQANAGASPPPPSHNASYNTSYNTPYNASSRPSRILTPRQICVRIIPENPPAPGPGTPAPSPHVPAQLRLPAGAGDLGFYTTPRGSARARSAGKRPPSPRRQLEQQQGCPSPSPLPSASPSPSPSQREAGTGNERASASGREPSGCELSGCSCTNPSGAGAGAGPPPRERAHAFSCSPRLAVRFPARGLAGMDGEAAGLWGFLPVADLVGWKSGGCGQKGSHGFGATQAGEASRGGRRRPRGRVHPPGTSQEGARSPQPTPGRIFLLASGSCCPTAIGAHHPLPVPPRVCIHLETQCQEVKRTGNKLETPRQPLTLPARGLHSREKKKNSRAKLLSAVSGAGTGPRRTLQQRAGSPGRRRGAWAAGV